MIFAALFFFLLSSCSVGGESLVSSQTVPPQPGAEADMVMRGISLTEVVSGGDRLSLHAERAYYYEGEKLLFFEGVAGNFGQGERAVHFTLPEGVYDREKGQILAFQRVTVSSRRGIQLQGVGGAFDLNARKVYVERNILLTSDSLRLEGETGEMDIPSGVVKMRKVKGVISSLEGVSNDVKGREK
ncbi:MAG: hypothetical protein D6713_06715 [Deltaproteobacteria bacterium]|nr:MAG: hypothetical protein D6713_06715 [Deltaproteobacteria bacterium]